jgi:hypothetical protein
LRSSARRIANYLKGVPANSTGNFSEVPEHNDRSRGLLFAIQRDVPLKKVAAVVALQADDWQSPLEGRNRPRNQ